MSLFAWTFLNFLAHCLILWNIRQLCVFFFTTDNKKSIYDIILSQELEPHIEESIKLFFQNEIVCSIMTIRIFKILLYTDKKKVHLHTHRIWWWVSEIWVSIFFSSCYVYLFTIYNCVYAQNFKKKTIPHPTCYDILPSFRWVEARILSIRCT